MATDYKHPCWKGDLIMSVAMMRACTTLYWQPEGPAEPSLAAFGFRSCIHRSVQQYVSNCGVVISLVFVLWVLCHSVHEKLLLLPYLCGPIANGLCFAVKIRAEACMRLVVILT